MLSVKSFAFNRPSQIRDRYWHIEKDALDKC